MTTCLKLYLRINSEISISPQKVTHTVGNQSIFLSYIEASFTQFNKRFLWQGFPQSMHRVSAAESQVRFAGGVTLLPSKL